MEGVADVLLRALNLEHRAGEYYFEASENARDKVVRAVLKSLADDEVAHKQVITRYYNALKATQGWPDVDTGKPIASADDRLARIADETAARIGPDSTYLSVYEVAGGMEVASRDYYASQTTTCGEDHKLCEFFKFLANMETVHMKMLDLMVDGIRAAARA